MYKRGCKFCAKLKAHHRCLSRVGHDDVLFENKHVAVVLGRPHHKGLLLVMPRVHEEHLLLLQKNTLHSFFHDTVLVMKALQKAIRPDRFNLAYLANWDAHIHWTIYPRFKTDIDYGNPPAIPPKGAKFVPKRLTVEERQVFLRELSKIKGELW